MAGPATSPSPFQNSASIPSSHWLRITQQRLLHTSYPRTSLTIAFDVLLRTESASFILAGDSFHAHTLRFKVAIGSKADTPRIRKRPPSGRPSLAVRERARFQAGLRAGAI